MAEPKKRKAKAAPAETAEGEEAAAGAAKSEAKSPKKKAKKDPSLPKGPLSSYLFFAAEHRGGIKDANPEFGISEVCERDEI